MATSTNAEKITTETNGTAANKAPSTTTVAVAGPSSRPSPSKQDVESIGRAMQLLAAGKRDLLISDPNAAVISLAQACELLGDHYGEVAYECAEAYYYYGVALLDLARMEAGVIDNVMDGIPEDDDDKEAKDPDCSVEDPEKLTENEKEEVAKQVDEALDENYKELEKLQKELKDKEAHQEAEANGSALSNGNGKKAESEGEDEDEDEDEEDEGEKSQEDDEDGKSQEDEEDEKSQESDKEGVDDAKAEEKGEAEKGGHAEVKDNESIGSDDKDVTAAKDLGDASAVEKEDEADPSNLQLAWEMLDLAKTILLKKADALKEALESSSKVPSKDDDEATKAAKEELEGVEFRISDAFQTLGELSIENENYPQAIEDLNACLAKRQSLLPEDSRCIAETHYQLGVARGFYLQFEDAVGSLNEAIRVLQKRVDNLKNKTESKDPNKAKDAFYTREKEIAEIEKLIPEIREKIADTEDMKRESHKRIGDRHLLEDAAAAASKSGAAGSSSSSAAASSSSSTAAPSSSSTANGDGPSSNSKEASTISSSLIKKRKKSGGDPASGDAAEGASSSSKKPHLEAAASTNGHNGIQGNGAN